MHTSTRVLRLRGDIDLATVEPVRSQWYRIADAERPTQITVDLAGVTFMGATGLGLLVGLLARQRAHGGRLAVRGAPARVVRLLQLTELAALFPDAGQPLPVQERQRRIPRPAAGVDRDA